jgi:hypothetical protein
VTVAMRTLPAEERGQGAPERSHADRPEVDQTRKKMDQQFSSE